MAALTKAAFLSKYLTIFADNISRAISEEDLRDFRQDIADSFVNISDASAVTGVWVMATIPVSSAEILALNTAPKLLVSSTGAGYGVVVDKVVFRKSGPTTAYATNTTLRVYLGSASTPIITDVTDFLTSAGARVQSSPTIAYGNTTVSGNHIYLYAMTGNPTTGNGDIEVDIIYKIFNTAGI